MCGGKIRLVKSTRDQHETHDETKTRFVHIRSSVEAMFDVLSKSPSFHPPRLSFSHSEHSSSLSRTAEDTLKKDIIITYIEFIQANELYSADFEDSP